MSLSFQNLQNLLRPFSRLAYDDLRSFEDLVHKLPLPDHSKQFVYAVREPVSQSVVYVFAAQNLSGRSAADSECLVQAVRPDAVVVQTGNVGLSEMRWEVMTRRCRRRLLRFLGGALWIRSVRSTREIFEIGFNGHFLAAKRATLDVGSSFVVLESSPLPDLPLGRNRSACLRVK